MGESDAASDEWLTTRQCADRLGVGTNFVVGEIRDGRLLAQVIERPGRKALYRISGQELNRYVLRYGWNGSPRRAAR
jgi:hypothetical protein